jgi:hydroxyacylglutathione hydrolase
MFYPIRIPFSVTAPIGALPRFVIVYLIATPDTLTLIDTGVAGSEMPILEQVQQIGRKPEQISTVIFTHAHPDHIGAAKVIQESTGCTIMAHAADRAWIENPDRQARERPVPGFSHLVGGAVTVDQVLTDGDIIELGDGFSLEVIHTPGHSPGSVCLFLLPDRELFSGDAVPVRGDLPIYDDPITSMQSINRLRKLEHIRSLNPSWDKPTEGKAAYQALDDGLEYLHQVHGVVKKIVTEYPSLNLKELTEEVLIEIGLPAEIANPMVTRSVLAHVRAMG